MRFLTNIYDPARPDASLFVVRMSGQSLYQSLAAQRQWLSDKIIGEPQATETYSSDELSKMGMVGVYQK